MARALVFVGLVCLAFTAAGAASVAAEADTEAVSGRQLLGGYWSWVDQTQIQASGNFAKNVGTAYQQSANQGVQQAGSWNSGGNDNSQSITVGPDGKPPPPGRKLLGGYWAWYPSVDQTQVQLSGNVAKNTGTAYQQSANQGLQQAGSSNYGVNSNSQSITVGPDGKPPPPGRKLLGGYWAWYPSVDQTQVQLSGNVAKNTGTAYQQSVNQGVQQAGYSNSGGNVNDQSITVAPAGKPVPGKP